MLFKYIFCKAYYFCIHAFKEREFPWAWAGLTTTMIVVATMLTLLTLFEVLMLPERINTYGEYHKYFSVAMAILGLFYIKYGDRYLRILETFKKLPEKRKKVLGYVSVIYLVILVVSFFWLGEIIREHNLSY